ncbi:toprim domain-containing protein [Actinomadura graeca]|uniref:Toprim domain-containing protein n=1 Tax=Actinomadura graeca TaxID=2750812 RepID=A0ABX8R0D9_9ACTN|nr:toprim domain-containing protein [Actinomadura graeca]QXJ24333.1 toprim domain-containing protein [Actinomadura graeca]
MDATVPGNSRAQDAPDAPHRAHRPRTPDEDRRRLPGVLSGIADRETARLRDGTRPWEWWLERAVLHGRRYGYTDTLLIAAQWRAATDVRSYEEWRAVGRQVRRGETGIRLLSPPGGLRAVFDVAQTDGLPLPPPARVSPLGLPSDRVGELSAALRERHGADRIEADSAAFLVLAWLGLEPRPPVFPVNAFWAGAETGDRILRLGRRVYETALDPSAGGVMAAAHRFFRARLAGSWVPAYLAGRGFPRGAQRRWRIGWAPPGPAALTGHLRGLGHADEDVVAAGLARRSGDGRLFDTFRDRAMFPIRTPDGAVAGFIGRRPDGGDGPKYLNGPGTDLFHKSELLFGLHEARGALAAGARPVLVEGPLDAVAVALADPAGHAPVATCGLSLTGAQVGALGGIADLGVTGVLVALDGDTAGRSGAIRAWETLAGVGGPLDLAALPPGRDPADLLRDGGRAAVRRALAAGTPLMDLVVDAAMDRAGGGLTTAEERLAAIRAAAAAVTARPSGAARQAVRIAARASVPAALITEALIDAAASG